VKKLKYFLLPGGFILFFMLILTSATVFAATREWIGIGFGPEMSRSLNWLLLGTPNDGDSIAFSTYLSARRYVWNDFDDYTFSGITFNSSAKEETYIEGNSINLDGNIENYSKKSHHTIALDMNLLRNVNLYSGAGSYNLELDGVISGGYGISKNGTSTLILRGANTYTGATTISEGTLQVGASEAIPDSSAVTVSSGAKLSLNGYNETIGSLAGSGTVNNNSATNAALTVGDATSTTFSGTLVNGNSGRLALTKQGSGTLTLGGANTYTGATTITNGTLTLNATGTIANSAGVANAGTFIIQGNKTIGYLTGAGLTTLGANTLTITDTGTYSGIASGTGGLTLNGAGKTLTLSGANTYTGATTITNGTLTLNATGTIANSAGVANAGTFIIQGNKTIGYLTGAGLTTLGANTLTITDTGTYSGIASGTGGLTMDGVGETLTLSGANTYSGATTITNGTLVLGNNLALQNSALDTSGAGAMNVTGFTTPTFGGLTGSNGLASVITTGYDSVTGITLNPGVGASNTYSGVIGNGAAGMTLTKSGAGTQTLSGANTYTGATTINAGTLTLDYSTQNNSKISESAELIMGGGILSLSGGTYTQVVDRTTLSSGDSFVTRPSGTAVLQMNTITVNDGATIDFSAGGIAKTNNNNDPETGALGTWATIAGTDLAKKDTDGFIIAFDGYVDIAAYGDVIENVAGNIVRINSKGTSGNITLGNADTTISTLLQNTGYDATVDTTGKTLRADGIIIGEGKGALTIGLEGQVGTLTSATTGGDIDLINYSNDEQLTINAVIADNGGASTLTKAGDGTLILNGINTYTGATIVGGGTLNLNQDLRYLSLSSELAFGTSGTVNLASGKNLECKVTTDENGAGTLNFLGGAQSVSRDIGTAAKALNKIDVASGTTTFNGDIYATTLSFSGDGTANIASGKSITGAVDNLTGSDGAGTLTLSGGNQAVSGAIGATRAVKTINIESGLAAAATFSGAVDAQNINMNGLGTAAFAGDLTGALNFAENGIATMASGRTITGAVDNTSGSADTGTLKFLGGTQSISGDIGSTNILHLVDIAAGTTTFDGDINTTTLNFSGDGTAVIASGKSINGDITADNTGEGTLTLAGGNQAVNGAIGAIGKALKEVNFNGTTTLLYNIYATDTNINSGGTLTASGNRTVTGNLTVGDGGILSFGSTTMQVASGVFSSASNSTISPQISGTTTGKITATGAAASVDNETNIFVNVVGYVPQNNQFTILESIGGIGTIPDGNIADDSRRFYFTQVADTDNLILLSNRYATFEDDGNNPNAKAVGRTLDAIDEAGATGDMLNIIDTLDALSDDEIGNALDSMSPVVDGANINLPETLLGQFKGIALLRLQDSKIEDASQSAKNEKAKQIPAGENILSSDIWAQVYGDYAHQGPRGLSNGYNARLWGMVFGLDRLFMEGDLRLGLSPGFGWAHIRSKDDAGRTRISSYQAQLYGQYQRKDSPFSLDAILAYGYNDYDSSRNVVVGSINRTANAKYYGQQFSTYLEAGYKIAKKILNIIPLLAIDYSHLYISGYTETGADSLNLAVNSQNYDSLKLGIGFRLNRAFESKAGIFTPELRFRYFYDCLNEKQQTLAAFAGGGTSFQTTGYRPAPSSFNLGARLEFFNKKNITLLADCNTVFKNDYYEAGGSLTFKYSF